MTTSPNLANRPIATSPKKLMDNRKKQVFDVKVLEQPFINEASRFENAMNSIAIDTSNKYENMSDNGSEISDEGYKSLGLVNAKRISLHSQVSMDDVENHGKSHLINLCILSLIKYSMVCQTMCLI